MLLKRISSAVRNGNASEVIKCVDLAVEHGYDIDQIINDALLIGMESVNKKFKNNEYFIPHLLLSTRAMNAGMKALRTKICIPNVSDERIKVVLGTIKGDLHDLGKNLVKALMEKEGLEVIDLGRDVNERSFAKAVKGYKADVVAISSGMTNTMNGIKDVIDELEKQGLRKDVLVMVGGIPITKRFAAEVGADISPGDTSETIDVIKKLFNPKKQATKVF